MFLHCLQTQKSTWVLVQGDGEYRGNDFTANLTVGNLDIVNDAGILVAHYLQRMTPKLDLGGELLYHYGSGQEVAVMSLAGRYSTDKWVGTTTVGQAGWHLSYWHKGNENVQVGVEYEYNLRAKDSCVSLGYQLDIPKANVVFRGMVDTNWTVAAVFEKRLLPLPFTFVLSGMVNHVKHQSRFGLGLTIG
jgi:mitochondrial import receptor subunit TOM40